MSDSYAEQAQASMSAGEYLSAYETALAGLADSPEDKKLRYLIVLALARMGATKQARQTYSDFQLDNVNEVDTAALDARIEKDIAIAAPTDEKAEHFLNAAKRYQAVFYIYGANDYYPAINAASMFYLAGDKSHAKLLAKKSLDLLGDNPNDYWSLATAAEAHLLSDNFEQCTHLLERAVQHPDATPANTASTRRQFKLLTDNESVLAPLTLPTIIHFAGHIIGAPGKDGRFPAKNEAYVTQQIVNKLDELNVMMGYGSLAAGADILFAEQILARGGELHVVLPFDKAEFIDISVAVSGADWVTRFNDCLDRASSCTFSSTGPYNNNDSLFNHCSIYAMGRACLRQQHLDAPITQCVVWSGDTTTYVAGTHSDRELWSNLGHSSHIIPVSPDQAISEGAHSPSTKGAQFDKQLKSVVFGDVAGFSKLNDAQIPVFVSRVMGELADALHQSLGDKKSGLLSINTWGDGIFIVFSNVLNAARCALAMQHAMSGLKLSAEGFSEQPQLRLGAHFGPIFEFKDPLTNQLNYFGQHVNTAARIEPIAPQGEVYVTEAFAAQLALDQGSQFQADYVGEMELAKEYGKARMYLLRG